MNCISNNTEEPLPAGIRRTSLLFFLAYGVYYGVYCLFLSFMVSYLTWAGYSALFCGVAGGLTYLISMVTQPVMGWLTDRWISMRRCLQGAALLSLIGSAAIPALRSSAPGLLLSLCFTAAFCIPIMSLLDVWVIALREQRLSMNYSLIRTGGSLGYGVVSLMMGAAAERWGIGILFPAQAAACGLLLAILCLLPDRIPVRPQKDARRPPSIISLGEIWRHSSFRAAVVLLFLYWLTHRLMGGYLALLVQSLGGDTAVFGAVVGFGGFAEALIPLFSRRWLQHVPLHRLMQLAFLINFARPLLFLAAVPFGTPCLALGQILQSLGFSIYFTASVECLSRLTPLRNRNTSISLALALSSLLGTVSANLAGGVMIDTFGALSTVGATLILASAALVWCLRCISSYPELRRSIQEEQIRASAP